MQNLWNHGSVFEAQRNMSDLSPKKKPTKHILYQEYRYEYGEELHKKMQFFWHTI